MERKTLFKTKLFGYSKSSVCEYLAQINDDFSQRLRDITAQHQKDKDELKARITGLESDLARYQNAFGSLEEALLEFPGCSVITSHDRWFMDRICTHILAWEGTDDNPGNWHWFEGNFADYQADRVRRLGADAARPHRLHRKLTRD